MKEVMIKASCWTCAKMRQEHGPRTSDVPTGTISYCGKTDEHFPLDVCRHWRPQQKWLDNQLWRAAQDTANAKHEGQS